MAGVEAWMWWAGALAVAVGIAGVYCYNRLVFNRHRVAEAWSGIDVQLKRRSSLVPSLVTCVKLYMAHERDTLESLVQQRANVGHHESDPVNVRGLAEGQLSNALLRVFALAESYPQLKADANFLALQKSLSELEEQIQMARRYYNGAVRELNIQVESVPSNLVARAFGFAPAAYFALGDAREGQSPALEL
ncbi:LemA family protein [Pseudomonas borbori]